MSTGDIQDPRACTLPHGRPLGRTLGVGCTENGGPETRSPPGSTLSPFLCSLEGWEAGKQRVYSSGLFGICTGKSQVGGEDPEWLTVAPAGRLPSGPASPSRPPGCWPNWARDLAGALGSGGLARKEALEGGRLFAQKVTMSCKPGQPGDVTIGADNPGRVCLRRAPPGQG